MINFVAPLVNPAQPRAGCIGCANLPLAPVLAQVLADRRSSALVVRGHDELDEISTATPTQVWVASGKTVRETVLDAADFGLPRSKAGDLAGGDATYNAKVAHRVLVGDRGPVRDAVLVNAAAGIAAYCGLDGDLTAAIGAGLAEATRSIDSGAARSALDRWVTVAQAASTTG